MLATKIGDPRLDALFGTSTAPAPRASVRPVVRLPRKGASPLLLAGAAVVAAAILFCALDQRRTSQTQPEVTAPASSAASSAWPAPPPLYLPPAESTPVEPQALAIAPLAAPEPVAPRAAPKVVARSIAPAPEGGIAMPQPQAAGERRYASSGSPLVLDQGNGSAAGPALPPVLGVTGARPSADLPSTERVRAGALFNPSTTIVEGTVVPAVLETGIDSARPGFVRAIVAHDVRSFDGTTVLIPRGSRLVGETRAASAGDNRAAIAWTRLIRPDGTTVDIDSPAADPRGTGGVPASVNSHFLARLGDTIVKTVTDFGRAFAHAGPFVILPGSGSSGGVKLSQPKRPPTLKVAPGTSMSVFLARDLDFSATEQPK